VAERGTVLDGGVDQAETSQPGVSVSEPLSLQPAQPFPPQIGFVPQTAPESESPICTRGQGATLCDTPPADSTRRPLALEQGAAPAPLRVGADC